MKKTKQILVALTAAFINVSIATAQPPGTPATTAPTMSVPSNPQAWCEDGGYCDNGSATPPSVAQTPPPRRPRPTQWNIVVNGSLDGNVRQHGTIDTDVGVAEFGIGGDPICPRGFIDLVIAPSGLTRLREAAGHRLVRGVYCARDNGILQSGDETDIDLSLYVTYEVFNLLVARVARLEDRMDQNDAVDVGQERDLQGQRSDIDDTLETVYRRDCADKMDTVSFQQWEAASPARRVELCPAVVVTTSDNGDRDRYFELQLGASGMFRNSGQRTLLGLDVSLQLTHLGDEGRGFYIQASSGYAGAVAQHGIPHREFARFMLVGASIGYAQRLGLNTSRVMLGIGGTLRATFVLPDPDRPGSIPDGYIGSQAGLAGFVSVDLGRTSNSSNIRPFLRLDGALMGGRETIYLGSNSDRSLTLPAGLVSEIRLSLGFELR